jgi:hypothetical protein
MNVVLEVDVEGPEAPKFVSNLTPLDSQTRAALKDHVPLHVATVYENLSSEDRALIARTIGPHASFPEKLGAYNRGQLEWIDDDRWYLGLRVQRDPSATEVMDDILTNGNLMRYKLCWLAMHPDHILLNASAPPGGLEKTTQYFIWIEAAKRFFDGVA